MLESISLMMRVQELKESVRLIPCLGALLLTFLAFSSTASDQNL